jgi:hypothetical protein
MLQLLFPTAAETQRDDGNHFSAPSDDSALYDPSANREASKLCSSLYFLKTRTSFSGRVGEFFSLVVSFANAMKSFCKRLSRISQDKYDHREDD